MAKLAIFCDGTWNGVRMTNLTNVARLARSVAPVGVNADTKEKVRQIVFYDEGVGVKSGISRINDEIEGIAGGAFGRGLDHRIEAAYRFIVMNYQPEEDELYVFGFSRGAYTARSLCGLIRKCGVLRRDCLAQIPAAMDLYRNRKEHPAGPECIAFRTRYAHRQPTGLEDMTDSERSKSQQLSKVAAGKTPGIRQEDVGAMPQETRRRSVKIRFLGLWDTVGSLGVPNRFVLLRGFNRKYEFHDTDASRLIENLRHATAVDEDRKVFDATSITNIQDLNIAAAAAMTPPKQVAVPNTADYLPYDERHYQQKWFPGDHGAVGGGNAEPGLSSAALLWVKEGAEKAGLTFDLAAGGEIREAERLRNPCAEFRIRKDGSPKSKLALDGLGLVGGYASRLWKITDDEIHPATAKRYDMMKGYRPELLERWRGEKIVPPHRTLGKIVSPLVRVVIWIAAAITIAASGVLFSAILIGLEAMRKNPQLVSEAVEAAFRWVIGLLT